MPFFAGQLNSGHAGDLGAWVIGDGPAVAAKATAPQNFGEPGECRSVAGFFADMLNSDKNACFSQTSCALPLTDFVLPEDERKPHAHDNSNCSSSTGSDDDDLSNGGLNASAPAVKFGFNGKRATKKFGRYGKRGGNKKINPLIVAILVLNPLLLSHVDPPLQARRSPRHK